METQLSGGESDKGQNDLFIATEGESRTIHGGWPTVVLWIQCSSFGSRGESMCSSWLHGK
jgi:hypothetical protein